MVGFAVGAFVVGAYVGLAVTLADGSGVDALEVDLIVGMDEALGPFVGSVLVFVGADVETATATVGDVEGVLEGRSEGCLTAVGAVADAAQPQRFPEGTIPQLQQQPSPEGNLHPTTGGCSAYREPPVPQLNAFRPQFGYTFVVGELGL